MSWVDGSYGLVRRLGKISLQMHTVLCPKPGGAMDLVDRSATGKNNLEPTQRGCSGDRSGPNILWKLWSCFTLTSYGSLWFVPSGLWTKNTAFWARDWGQKKGAVRLRPWKEALREFGHPKSYPVNSLLVNVSPSKGPSYCSLNLILGLN